METLKDKLLKFKPSSEAELLQEGVKNPLYGLAKAFLYGGYVQVKDSSGERYRIYLRTIEFYCHSEEEHSNLPKDPIVYHRNWKYIKCDKENEISEVPYFPLMAFHAHASGIDITFENQELKLRSSVLIRAYEVYDVKLDKFLIFDKGKIVECRDDKKRVNTQSTYLYYFLNGFIGDNVKWEDAPWPDTKSIKGDKRKNVFKYDEKESFKEDENGKKIRDDRKWSYTRLEDLTDKQL